MRVDERSPLRRGWTTGACAAAAAKAAYAALRSGVFPDPVEITLPGGQRPAFALAETRLSAGAATAGVIKDAGDDPDVTHGALVRATISAAAPGSGLIFRAGRGVGTVTRPGLPLPPGEPAINPVPRRIIAGALADIGPAHPDLVVEIGIEGGEALAERTLNGRLGIVGGLSVLGTTGIVVPYSCAAWIDTIRRGIDVARACGLDHVAGATGRASEVAIRARHGLSEIALIDMGDFVGGMLKYLRTHPVPRVTIAGGLAKMTKLAQGRLDLHAARGGADMVALGEVAGRLGNGALAARIGGANTVAEAFAHADAAGVALGDAVARAAWQTAAEVLDTPRIALEVVLFDRDGRPCGAHGFAPAHDPSRPRNRR
ncbi:cobalamin (vitamin B12) biosynthesis protein cobalt-precorrin-6A biosynthesis protein CbiD [Acidisphaera rubrifaciens HS-AP3]|uniref:Cobalt-precorrin-5B C(1)-methyltransferase n=1 Tax=Acidisphaera rubrifaciens HS-AP3 TaxID=1231350 RepID=A0A0D6P7I6_9PROT|nr:cobalamin (vitamin B12) biosynthesis protein cobalt-precorrin-6A biosynthesis protein CbiD [Acidisphaera rubrifaciens HS-AP3]